jgi:RNA polymerase sigma-70 factor (ECF subfamily)
MELICEQIPVFVPVLDCRGDQATTKTVRARTAEEVFHEFAPRVYAVARRMLGQDADAEDVTQDVLVQVVRKLDTFRGESELSTWLHRITVNAALALRRRRSRLSEQHLEISLDYLPQQTDTAGGPPEEKALRGELLQQLEAAIARLPEKYRDTIVLADVEGLPNSEVGELLGLSLPAVKSRLHRARLMLREYLAPYFSSHC